MSALTHLDHVVVAVREIDPALGRWARLLGRRPSWRGEHPGEGSENVLFRLSNTYLELLAPVGEGRRADALRARLESHGEGPVALALGTDDADARCSRPLGGRQGKCFGQGLSGRAARAGRVGGETWTTI